MKIDLDQVAAVERTLDTVDRNGEPAKLVIASRSYPTTIDDLWDALTTPERLPRWFAPVSGDLRVGGRYQVEGNAGGEVLACEPPRRFEITWEMHDSPSWVEVVLTEEGGGSTRLELRHTAHVPTDFWDEFGPGAVGVGWDLALLGLHLHTASGGAAVDTVGLQTAPEVLEFSARSSEAWTAASIAAGTDPAAARAAGERTTTFFTTVPE